MASLSSLKGESKMNKDIMKSIGNIAEEVVKGVAGNATAKNRTSVDRAGNIVDSIINTISGALGSGGGGRGGGKGGGGGGGRGRA